MFGKTIAVTALALTLVAPAQSGHGGNAASHYTPQALKALGLQWEAKASFYGKRSLSLKNDRPAASFYTQRALRAMGERGEAMSRFYESQPHTTSSSFD